MSDKPNTEAAQTYALDQVVSINSYFDVQMGGETVRLQITSRNGADAARIAAVVMEHIEAISKLRGTYPRPTTAPAEPTRVPVDDNGNEQPAIYTATAGRLSMDVHDNKAVHKVMDCIFPQGARKTKFGITVWPEVLQAAGIDVTKPLPDITGWRVDYILGDKGYPQKVVRLLPPK